MHRTRVIAALGLAACGGGGSSAGDDTGGGAAVVRVADPVGPREGIDVVFTDAAGALIAHLKTGADGVAHAAVGAGATVTVAAIGDGTRALTTIAGVDDGDDLAVPMPWGPRPAPTRTLTATVGAGPAGTDTYQVIAGCQNASFAAPGSTELAIPEPCITDGRVTVLALATMAGTVLGYSTIDAAVGADPVVLPPWQTDLTPLDVTVTAPADASTVFTAIRIDAGDTQWYPGGGATAAFSLARPVGFGDSVIAHVFASWQDGAEFASVSRRTAPVPGALAVDAVAEQLPRVTGLAVDATDAARPVVRWQLDRDLAGGEADGAIATLQWDDGDPLVWSLIAPAAATQAIAAPALPDALALWRPTAAASSVTAGVFARDSLADYAAVRAAPANLMDSLPRAGEDAVAVSFSTVTP